MFFSSPALLETTDNATVNGTNSHPPTMNLTPRPRPSVIRYVHHKQRPVQRKSNNRARPQCPVCNSTFSKAGSLKVGLLVHKLLTLKQYY